ncbi:hypothetical protein JCM10213_001348 [Rhodosporidiobolus nylandii]
MGYPPSVASAAVFYGVGIRASTLIYAFLAWLSSEPAVHALRVIRLRRKAGTLQASPAVQRIPTEVWDKIEREVIAAALAEAGGKGIEALEHCRGEGEENWPLAADVLAEDGDSSCPQCGTDVLSDSEGVYEYLLERHELHEDINDFLIQYGLQLPLSRSYRFEGPNDYTPEGFRTFDDLVFLSIPVGWRDVKRVMSQDGAAGIQAYTNGTPYDPIPGDNRLIALDGAIPADADLRFARFVRLYNVEVVGTLDGTLDIHGSKAPKKDGTQPGWRLFLTQ